MTPNLLYAQSSHRNDWWDSTEQRIRAIYDRGELRGKRFEAEWLPDSSGYVVRERNHDGRESRVVHDVASGARRELTDAEIRSTQVNSMRSPDGRYVLQYEGRNLYAREVADGTTVPLLNRPDGRDVEFQSPRWSPDSRRIVCIESDQTNVRLRPVLVPTDPSYPEIDRHRFARVGEKIPVLRVGVIDIETQHTRWLPIESPEEGFYLGQVDWAGNSDEILVETLSRFRNERSFTLHNLKTGSATQIYHETNEAWAVSSQGKNLGLTWIRDGEAFLVISEQDGWRHAFLYARDGKQLALLTPGDYDIIEPGRVDERSQCYYFYASPQNATQKYLYRVPLDGSGSLTRVTPETQSGTHEYLFSPDAKWALQTSSTLDTPPLTQLVELPTHRIVRVLEENSDLRATAKQWIPHPTEFLQLDIGDHVTLDAWLIKPRDFDPSRKYPIFVYVYGEPHLQTVLDSWGAAQNHFLRVVADLGYLVVSIDNRGTPAPKGAAWRRSIFGSLGPLSTEDQAAALQELARTRSYVDLSRVGIWGWSGGGSNTLNAMFRKPDLYHVGIAVVPKPQPHLYNAWFQEIYMRTREVNPEGYERSAPINFAAGLKGDLLMITGSGETNTHMQIIDGLVDRLIELGKPFDYMVYPNRNHGLREGLGSEVHVRMLIIRYLVEHLPRGPASDP